jgi:hypothetical protein
MMNWDALGAISEGLGSAVVVVTLIYLATQVRLSVANSRFIANNTTLQHGTNIWTSIMESPQLAGVLYKLKTDADLAAEESVQADAFAQLTYIFYLNQIGAASLGVIPDEDWRFSQNDLRGILNSFPGLRQRLKRIVDRNPASKHPIWSALSE